MLKTDRNNNESRTTCVSLSGDDLNQLDKHLQSMEKQTEYMMGFRSALGSALNEVRTMRTSLSADGSQMLSKNKESVNHKSQQTIITDTSETACNTEYLTTSSYTQTQFFNSNIRRKELLKKFQSNQDGLHVSLKNVDHLKTGIVNKNEVLCKLASELKKSMVVRVKREIKLEEKLKELSELKRKLETINKDTYKKEKVIQGLRISVKMERDSKQQAQHELSVQRSHASEFDNLHRQISDLKKILKDKDYQISKLREEKNNENAVEYIDIRSGTNSKPPESPVTTSPLRSQSETLNNRPCLHCTKYKHERDDLLRHYYRLTDECDYYKRYIYDWQTSYESEYYNNYDKNSQTSQNDMQTKPNESRNSTPANLSQNQTGVDSKETSVMVKRSVDLNPQTYQSVNTPANHANSSSYTNMMGNNSVHSSCRSTPALLYSIDESEESNAENYTVKPTLKNVKPIIVKDSQQSINVKTSPQPMQSLNNPTESGQNIEPIVGLPINLENSDKKCKKRIKNESKDSYSPGLVIRPIDSKTVENIQNTTPGQLSTLETLHGDSRSSIHEGAVVWHPTLLSHTRLVEDETLSSESGASDSNLHSKSRSKRKVKRTPKKSNPIVDNNRPLKLNKNTNEDKLKQYVNYKGHDIDITKFSIHQFREILWSLESESSSENTSNDFLKFLAHLAKKLNNSAEWNGKHSLGKPKDWLALRGCV